MLKLVSNGGAIINTDDFYIVQKTSGIDELVFSLSVHDENYNKILEEAVIEYEQPYIVKAIDAGTRTAKVKCQLNLDTLKAAMYPDYANGSATLAETVNGVLPTGWIFLDNSYSDSQRTLEGGYTPYDIIMLCADTYKVAFRFDVRRKRITAYNPDSFEPKGAFATRELNLKEISYKGKSTSFCTRLYGYGKNGLSFADINGGKPYVDNFQYSDKIVCSYWQDDRYTVKETLLEDAKEKLKVASVPERSYECTVMDLAKTNPNMYGFQDFSLFAVVRLIDDVKNISINYQVVEYCEYPNYPEKNVVTLSSTAPKIQDTLKDIKNEITNPNSGFWNVMHNAIDSATDWITGVNGGYVIFHKDENDIPYEILVMNTPDIATATNVWRWNQNGFGHSSKGYNGPYDLAMTIDGSIVADFITAGTMLANRIRGGTLDIGGDTGADGVIRVFDINKKEIGRWDKDGLDAKAGKISGASVTLGGADNKAGILKLLGADDKVISRMDNSGIMSAGTITSMNPSTKLAAFLSNGALSLTDKDGKTSAILSYLNDGITIQSYGGSNNAHIILKRNGTVFIQAIQGLDLACHNELTINARKCRSGRAEFSDGSYLEFEKGFLVGGNTTEGGGF